MLNQSRVEWKEEDKSVILVCSDNLWNYLQQIRKTGLDNLDLIQVAKMYKELKSLDINLEKDKQNDKK